MKVLVIDESTTIQKVIALSLESATVEIIGVQTIAGGLRCLQDQEPQVVIVDGQLVVDPKEKAKVDQLRHRIKRIPHIALLGSYGSVSAEELAALGFVGVLKKPFEPQGLIESLEIAGVSFQGTDATSNSFGHSELQLPPTHKTGLKSSKDLVPSPPENLSYAEPKVKKIPLDASEVPKDDNPLKFDHVEKVADSLAESRASASAASAINDLIYRQNRFNNDAVKTSSESSLNGPEQDSPFLSQGVVSEQFTENRFGSSKGNSPPIPAPPKLTPMHNQTEGSTSDLRPSPLHSRDPSQALMNDQVPKLVRQAVLDYCKEHFRPMAREVLTSELRRLADERAKIIS